MARASSKTSTIDKEEDCPPRLDSNMLRLNEALEANKSLMRV